MSDLISRQAAIDAIKEQIFARIDWLSDSRMERRGLDVALCVIEDLPSAQPEERWIPVTERLPKVGREVLVCFDFKDARSVYIANFYGDGEFHGLDDEYLIPEARKHRKAVAWMPLPKPYKGESEGTWS